MDHGDRLTGTVKSLNEKNVTLSSPLASNPLVVKSNNIQSISLTTPSTTPPQQHKELITLSNGDALPCHIVSLNKETLKISTQYAGSFDIPRQNIQSLQFGIIPDKTIYLGTDPPEKWDSLLGQWQMTENGYLCEGSGTLARKLALPDNLRINFNLTWKNTPNIAFRFFASNKEGKKNQNCYEFAFNSNGIQIRRFFGKQAPTPITSLNFKPYTIDTQKINIDLRINRTSGKITLSLDGLERGTWIDPLESTKGNYIIISNRATRGESCQLGNLKITQWMEESRPDCPKKLIQEKVDILIDSEGEKLSGNIVSIQTTPSGKRAVKLKVKYAQKPITIPSHRISCLILAKDAKTQIPTPQNSYFSALFRNGSSLLLQNPQLQKDKITLTHPILGKCTLNTSVIDQIIYHKTDPKKESLKKSNSPTKAEASKTEATK